MRLCFTFRHCEPTEALKAFAERKFARIAKSLKRSCEVHLIFSVDKYRQSGEATVKSGRFSFVAQTTDKDLYAVIDGLIDKVDRQLKDHLHRAETGRTRALSAAEALAEA
ncbi:MAG TPA: ribosome-associated translation inhibitor RaiA [Candidatus Binataceae bacterium]|jgi:putative sigma-54 modulation protein|nr:ribosome-associated translation inhibitor RaiA [Candidatus Binataceae bacterium]